jgi:ABC-2 type transport system ATP-binding protein
VELVSDQAAILKNGRMIEKGTIEDFISVKQQYQLQLEDGLQQINSICQNLNIPLTSQNGMFTVSIEDDAQLNHLIDQLRSQKTNIQAIIPRKITLEDFFINVLETGEGGQK